MYKETAPSLENEIYQINLTDLPYPIRIRKGTTDLQTFNEVFVNEEYYFDKEIQVDFIIDCGANIGLTSIYLKWQFPNAFIVAVEPEKSNYDILIKNLSNYSPSIQCLQKAIWNKETELRIKNKDAGKWAFSVEETLIQDPSNIKAITIDNILIKFGRRQIDILKIDIEGAELELFQSGYENWLPITKLILIETHDRIRNGCSASLLKALSHYNFSIYANGNTTICLNLDI